MGEIAKAMERKIRAALTPAHLRIDDDSERHRGHGGWRAGGESHFRLEIAAESFRGKSRLERQRLIHALLGEELGRIHALSLDLRLPGEF
jgi:BolA family transcriptional regulator, general stress-responsive regulator